MQRFLSVKEVAESLGMSIFTIHRYVTAGRLPSVRMGRRRLIPEAELEELLRRSRQGASHSEEARR